jgi:tRNA uridine 5-carboxymethylaminomethyl modification enzyme
LVKAELWVRQVQHEGLKLDQWLRRSENSWSLLPESLLKEVPLGLWNAIETDIKYEGHLARQRTQVARLARQEGRHLPEDLDYTRLPGLKKEAQLRFTEIRPVTLGQAGRIPGITPADVALLAVWLEKRAREAANAANAPGAGAGLLDS